HVLAGFDDGRADEGPAAGGASLLGLRIARENGWTAPRVEGHEPAAAEAQTAGTEAVGEDQSSALRKPTTPADTRAETVDKDVKGEAK
ncbi:NADH-quinone oxidoreductase subunit NuoE, partial [Georgenia sp. 10Sc9-8]|nr:NADH-quinone oxidoreductase subunit NuoE [Georgenia halotolerans]